MKTRSFFMFNRFLAVALLLALLAGVVPVRTVYAASIVVNSSADNVINDGFCTLREALNAAQSNGPGSGCTGGSAATADVITFTANFVISLNSRLPAITSSVIIQGRGAANTIIQAATSPNVATWRVFQVLSSGNLTLDGVTVRHGRCIGSCQDAGAVEPDSGGGIYNEGILTVINSAISDNRAELGGGIINWKTLTVTNSTFSGNSAVGVHPSGQGGGIYNDDQLTVTNSTFSGNTAVYGGGGIINYWVANIKGSTFTGNSATGGNPSGSGGAIFSAGTVNLTNSTIHDNDALSGEGGGIYDAGTLNITNSTIALNDSAQGNGVFTIFDATLKNTIVANNFGPNCGGNIINGGSNLEDGSSCGWGSTNGSRSNTNPNLFPLANNGGPTQTMKLGNSPAVEAGNASICAASPVSGVDQRGVTRPLGTGCDIGAYETTSLMGPDTAGVFRPSNGALYLKNLNITGFADIQINYGLAGDYPVTGDWDAFVTDTIGIYRNGSFYLRNSNTIGFADLTFPFGMPGDQPVAGDWDGDGDDTIGVYRNGTFYLRNSNSAGAPDMIFSLGVPGDIGIAGDWNGDGRDTTGVFRPSNGALYLKNTNATGFAEIQINYGLPGDQPVVGDWNDDGIDTIGVYRNGTFLLRNSNTIGFAEIEFGLGVPGDHPIAGNWDGTP